MIDRRGDFGSGFGAIHQANVGAKFEDLKGRPNHN
jgi:hypothetical protein